jgi:hypothetical protein
MATISGNHSIVQRSFSNSPMHIQPGMASPAVEYLGTIIIRQVKVDRSLQRFVDAFPHSYPRRSQDQAALRCGGEKRAKFDRACGNGELLELGWGDRERAGTVSGGQALVAVELGDGAQRVALKGEWLYLLEDGGRSGGEHLHRYFWRFHAVGIFLSFSSGGSWACIPHRTPGGVLCVLFCRVACPGGQKEEYDPLLTRNGDTTRR